MPVNAARVIEEAGAMIEAHQRGEGLCFGHPPCRCPGVVAAKRLMLLAKTLMRASAVGPFDSPGSEGDYGNQRPARLEDPLQVLGVPANLPTYDGFAAGTRERKELLTNAGYFDNGR